MSRPAPHRGTNRVQSTVVNRGLIDFQDNALTPCDAPFSSSYAHGPPGYPAAYPAMEAMPSILPAPGGYFVPCNAPAGQPTPVGSVSAPSIVSGPPTFVEVNGVRYVHSTPSPEGEHTPHSDGVSTNFDGGSDSTMEERVNSKVSAYLKKYSTGNEMGNRLGRGGGLGASVRAIDRDLLHLNDRLEASERLSKLNDRMESHEKLSRLRSRSSLSDPSDEKRYTGAGIRESNGSTLERLARIQAALRKSNAGLEKSPSVESNSLDNVRKINRNMDSLIPPASVATKAKANVNGKAGTGGRGGSSNSNW